MGASRDRSGSAAGPPGAAPPEGEGPPPLGGSWRRLYLLVLGVLAATVALLALLTWSYR